MNRFLRLFAALFVLFFIYSTSIIAQDQEQVKPPQTEVENYREQIRRLLGFLEFSLNTLGSSETSAREKEVIINESYLKAFLNDKVQVEDDLDQNREMITYKEIQAYLKDVDFFFKDVTIQFDISDIQQLTTADGMMYFKVTANRHLAGTTVEDEVVDNNLTRYIEINLDEKEMVLKIASIYTTKLNEEAELMDWWSQMPYAWKKVLGTGHFILDSIPFRRISFLNDSTVLINPDLAEIINLDTILVQGQDTMIVHGSDSLFLAAVDTIPLQETQAVRILKDIIKLESLDLSNNLEISNLSPLSQLTSLRSLNIANTLVSDLFPVRNLTKLVSLNCSGTAVSDLEPVKYNTQIMELYIDQTMITSLWPIENFQSLEMLHVIGTKIDSLQPVASLTGIREIRLDDTPVSDLTPLGDLVNLEMLSISGTAVINLAPIQYLTSLKRINFENTAIDSLQYLSKLNNLQIIDCDQSKIFDLTPLEGLESLEKIYCDKTLINREKANAFMSKHRGALVIYESEELTKWWTDQSYDWKVIFGSLTEMSTPPTREQLHQLTLLISLDISGKSNITSLDPVAKLTNLNGLNCSGSAISDLGPLGELIDLEILDISDTRVKSLIPLQNLVHLEELYASGTELVSLDGLTGLPALHLLDIDETSVDQLVPIHENKSLRSIYCDHTKIGKKDIDDFHALNPECLVIYQTDMLESWWGSLSGSWKDVFSSQTTLDEQPGREQLQALADLKSLNFDGNQDIKSLEPLTILTRLENLSMSGIQLPDLTFLAGLVNLKELNVSGNPVSKLQPLSNLNNLTDLNISSTAVESFDKILLPLSLEYLNCSGTPIKKIDPLATLPNLKRLDISNTNVKSLKPLEGISTLKYLKCFNTSIPAKKVDAFKALTPWCEVVYY